MAIFKRNHNFGVSMLIFGGVNEFHSEKLTLWNFFPWMNSRFLSFVGWNWMWDGTFFEQVFFCLRLLVSLVVIVNIFIVSLFLPDITQINLMTRRNEMCVSNDPELIVESCTVWMGSFESSVQEWPNKGTCCFVLRRVFCCFQIPYLVGS